MSSDRKVSASVTLLSDAGDEATVENLPVSVIQAIYHDITGKTETLSRDYNDSYLVRADDIIQIAHQLKQFAEQFKVAGYSEQVSVEHYGTKEVIVFSSLDKFRTYQTSIKDPTHQINLTVTFLISNPNYGKYQNYRIDISVNSYNLLKNYSNLRYHYNRSRPSIVSKVEYVDYTVGRSFSTVIERWIDSLDVTKLTKKPRWLDAAEEMPHLLSAGISMVFFLSSLPLSLMILRALNYSDVFSFKEIAMVIYIVVGVVGSMHFLSRMAADFIEYRLWNHGHFCFTLLNDGDSRNYELFTSKNAKLQKIYNYVIYGIILVVIVNIFSNFIYDLLKRS